MSKFLIKLTIFAIIFVIFNHTFVNYYYKENKKNNPKITKWNSIKNKSDKYDIILLGSSRCYSSFNPLVIDSITKMKSFNMCTGLQNLKESYFILKDILRFQNPKYIVYEIYPPCLSQKPDLVQVFKNSEQMSQKGKWDILTNGYFKEKLIDILIPIKTYSRYIRSNPIRLLKGDNKIYIDDSKWFKGYKYDAKSIDSTFISNLKPIEPLRKMEMSKIEIEKNMTLLIELCKENNLELIFIRTAYPPKRFNETLKDENHIYFRNFSLKKGISFYDLNYSVNKEYKNTDFSDSHHLNSKGAEKASIELSIILNDLNFKNITK